MLHDLNKYIILLIYSYKHIKKKNHFRQKKFLERRLKKSIERKILVILC